MSSKRTSAEEIYSLVMECKASSLSDAQWCLEHWIQPSTFYNWVSRLRRRACDIPQSVNHSDSNLLHLRLVIYRHIIRQQVYQPTAHLEKALRKSETNRRTGNTLGQGILILPLIGAGIVTADQLSMLQDTDMVYEMLRQGHEEGAEIHYLIPNIQIHSL